MRERWRAYAELLRARWSLLAALSAVGLGMFFKLASELRESGERGGGLQALDQRILDFVIAHRIKSWNASALELTSLGSGTVITLVVVIAVFFMIAARDYLSALQLSLAGLGGLYFTNLLKRVLERERPDRLHRLAEVTSYSFPSGHSVASATVYLTLGLVLARHMPTHAGRLGLFAVALFLSALVGFTRAYIGVHFPSDIAAGLSFGWSWALLLSAGFSYYSAKAAQRRQNS